MPIDVNARDDIAPFAWNKIITEAMQNIAGKRYIGLPELKRQS